MATDPAAMITLLSFGGSNSQTCVYIYIYVYGRTCGHLHRGLSLLLAFEIVPVERDSLSTRTRQKRSEGEGTSGEAWRSAEEEREGDRKGRVRWR